MKVLQFKREQAETEGARRATEGSACSVCSKLPDPQSCVYGAEIPAVLPDQTRGTVETTDTHTHIPHPAHTSASRLTILVKFLETYCVLNGLSAAYSGTVWVVIIP